LFLVFLEIGLRLSGFILTSLQEHRNILSIRQKGAYRILCLGESTTAGQFPEALEKILNKSNLGIKFSVIDKGESGVTTEYLLGQLKFNLDKYHPDMVVAMMGINDSKERIPYMATTNSKVEIFLKSFRTYKLAKLLWLHILNKAKEIGVYKPKARDSQSYFLSTINLAEDSLKKTIQANPRDNSTYVESARVYREQKKYPQAEEAYRKAIELDPGNNEAYLELGRIYREQVNFAKAEQAFRKAIEVDPKNNQGYVDLGWIFQDQKRFFEAEQVFYKAIEINPKDHFAYEGLGWIYREQSNFTKAEQAFRKATELDRNDYWGYYQLGRLYRDQFKYPEAEQMLKKANELNPGDDLSGSLLGWIYQDQKRYLEAEQIFKKAIKLDPQSEYAIGGLIIVYSEMGKKDLAREYIKKLSSLRLGYYNPNTMKNYCKLKEILEQRKIQLVCVQYPACNILPLKIIFREDEDIILVDNEELFKEAVKKEGFSVYFRDMFAGNFGHCTEKGNRLLAKNIANVLLREVFTK
jgi:tetratricopeptide (TPR) repeat protein